MKANKKSLTKIWNQVPPDYYQNGVAKNYLQRTWHLGKLKAVLALIGDFKPKNILDVGCASGWFLSELHLRYPKTQVFGLDIYKEAILYGKKKYKKIKFTLANGDKLPYKNNSFDLVICTEVLEHVERPEKVLKEIRRVLTPRGIAIVEMDSGNLLFTLIWHWWTNMRRGVWRDAHIHSFTEKKLEKMIRDQNFFIKEKIFFNYTMAVAFKLSRASK